MSKGKIHSDIRGSKSASRQPLSVDDLLEDNAETIDDILGFEARLYATQFQLAEKRTVLLSRQLKSYSNRELNSYYSQLNKELDSTTRLNAKLRADLKFISAQLNGLFVISSKAGSDDPKLTYSTSQFNSPTVSHKLSNSRSGSTRQQASMTNSSHLTDKEVQESLVNELIKRANVSRAAAIQYAKIAMSFDPSRYVVGGEKQSYKDEFISANSEVIRLRTMLLDSEAEVKRLREIVAQSPSELELKHLRAKSAQQDGKINTLRAVLAVSSRGGSQRNPEIPDSILQSKDNYIDELSVENTTLRTELDNQIKINNAQNKVHRQEVERLRKKIKILQSEASNAQPVPTPLTVSESQFDSLKESEYDRTSYSEDNETDRAYIYELEDDLTRALARINVLTEENASLQAYISRPPCQVDNAAMADNALMVGKVQELTANNLVLSNALTTQHQQLANALSELNQKNTDQLILQDTIQQLTAQQNYNAQAMQLELTTKLNMQADMYNELNGKYKKTLDLVKEQESIIRQLSEEISANDRITLRHEVENKRIELRACQKRLEETQKELQEALQAKERTENASISSNAANADSTFVKEQAAASEGRHKLVAQYLIKQEQKPEVHLASNKGTPMSKTPSKVTPAAAIEAAITGGTTVLSPQRIGSTQAQSLLAANAWKDEVGSAANLIRSMRVNDANIASSRLMSSTRVPGYVPGTVLSANEILSSYTPLMKAVSSNDKNAVSRTIGLAGQAALDGTTALMLAAISGNQEIVEMLAPHEATMKRKDGATALKLALEARNLSIASILQNFEGLTAPRPTPTYPRKVTALMTAAEAGDIVAVFSLMESQAKAQDLDGRTALMRAARAGFTEIVWLLSQHEAGMQLVNDTELGSGSTALMFAAHNGHLECVEILAPYERDIHNSLNYDALFYAQSSGPHVPPADRASIIALLNGNSVI